MCNKPATRRTWASFHDPDRPATCSAVSPLTLRIDRSAPRRISIWMTLVLPPRADIWSEVSWSDDAAWYADGALTCGNKQEAAEWEKANAT